MGIFMRFGQSGSPVRLRNVNIPGCFLGRSEDLVNTGLTLHDGKIIERGGKDIEMDGAMVFPCFVDMHTHLDQSQIWQRCKNPDGTLLGALTATRDDREQNWSESDLFARMNFSLKCAYAHGTRSIRTHLDSLPPQDEITWPVFAELRQKWAGKIDLQGVSLVSCDSFDQLALSYGETADIVAAADGVLGMSTFPLRDLDSRLLQFFGVAGARDMDVDFHCDETLDPGAETLRMIAKTVLEIGWTGPVTVAHCCSLSTQDEARALNTLDLVAKAGINVVCLPFSNAYLQDRRAGRTPRQRGITLVHEMFDRGINVSFGSDNTRDPFHAYGDLDMIDVMRQATRLGQLDHSHGQWPMAFNSNPAEACGFPIPSLAPGSRADLVIVRARNWSELFARPQTNRIVVRNGEMIETNLPDFAELDPFMANDPEMEERLA